MSGDGVKEADAIFTGRGSGGGGSLIEEGESRLGIACAELQLGLCGELHLGIGCGERGHSGSQDQ